MKKVMLTLISLLMCFGCQSKTQENPQMTQYEKTRDQLIACQQFDQNDDFHVQVIFNEIDDGYRYDVVIDQPKRDMYDIHAIAYANESENQMCPTIGFFDDESYHLCVNKIDKANGYYKGVQLSGECSKKQTVRLYIYYFTDVKKTKKVEKMIEVI